MTTIAASMSTMRGTWSIAADGQTTSGDRPFESRHQPKIVTRSDYTFATAGKGYACDVAQFHWVPPVSQTGTGVSAVYMHVVKSVVPSLRDAFDRAGVTFEGDESFQMILAHRGVLLQIESDFTVLLDESGWYAIGSGAPYALGALAMGATPEEAVRTAAMFDIWTGFGVEVRGSENT